MDADRSRVILWAQAWGSAFSQMLNVLVRAPLFILLGDAAPDPDETLSAVVGRRAADGARWARVLAVVIDVVMLPLERFRMGHCARAAALHASRS